MKTTKTPPVILLGSNERIDEVFTVWMPDYSKHWHIMVKASTNFKKEFHKKAKELSGIKDYSWERAISYDTIHATV